MEKGKYPIIANGELYVESISKKINFPPKEGMRTKSWTV